MAGSQDTSGVSSWTHAGIHRVVADRLGHARIWGKQARFDGQQADREHLLIDGDVVELHS